MIVQFNTYLNKKLTKGSHFVKVVNIDNYTNDENYDVLKIKFANAEGFASKTYVLDNAGLLELYHDFIFDYYVHVARPIVLKDMIFNKAIQFADPTFDCQHHVLNSDYEIKIEPQNDMFNVINVNLIDINYWMAYKHNKPYIDRQEDFEEKRRVDAENQSNYNNYKSSDSEEFEFGGLRGEEAETLYWNID
jgi:hypothetical protein